MPVPTQPQTPDEMIVRSDGDDTIKVEPDSDSSNNGGIHSPALHAYGRDRDGPREAIALRADQVHGRVRTGGNRDGQPHPQSLHQPLPPPDFHSSTRDPKRPADAKAAAKEGVVHEDATNTENDPKAVKVMKDEAKGDASPVTKSGPTGNSV